MARPEGFEPPFFRIGSIPLNLYNASKIKVLEISDLHFDLHASTPQPQIHPH